MQTKNKCIDNAVLWPHKQLPPLPLDVDQVPDINFASVEAGSVAVDVVFNPAETGFLKKCEEQGAVSVNGLGMLACQGGLNFTLWTGVEAPFDVMEAKLREEFNL